MSKIQVTVLFHLSFLTQFLIYSRLSYSREDRSLSEKASSLGSIRCPHLLALLSGSLLLRSLYEFPAPDVTNYCKFSGLKQRKFSLSQSGGPRSTSRSAGSRSPEALGEGLLGSLTSGGPGGPGLTTASLQPLPRSTPGHLLFSVCLSWRFVIDAGSARITQDDFILQVCTYYLCKRHFVHTKSHS